MQLELPKLRLMHESFEKEIGCHVSRFSFRITETLHRTKYSSIHRVTLEKPPNSVFIMEVITKMRLFNPTDFLQSFVIMHEINHRNIAKIYTIFEEDGIIYILKENPEFIFSEKPSKMKGLSNSRLASFLAQILSALQHFNSLNILSHTIDLRPENLFYKNETLKIANIVNLDYLYQSKTYGYFSVPEQVTTKEKIDIWNIGFFLLDLVTNFNILDLSKTEPCCKLLKTVTDQNELHDDIKIILGSTLCKVEDRLSITELKHSKFISQIYRSNRDYDSNSFSFDPKNINDFPAFHEESLMSFEVSNNGTFITVKERKPSIKPPKQGQEETLQQRLQELEARLQSISEFKRKMENKKTFDEKRDSEIKERVITEFEILLEKHEKTVF